MPTKSIAIVPLAEMTDGQEADTFVLLSGKSESKTREGKIYWRVSLRDAQREVTFPIWSESPFADDCREHWRPGMFFKVRGVYRETSFGPQLDIRKIRPVVAEDKHDGFDEWMCQPRSKFDPLETFHALVDMVRREVQSASLAKLTIELLESNRDALLRFPAARRNHHAFAGGLIEHLWSVTKNAVFLAARYAADYPELQPPLHRDLVIVGAALHDIGKVLELRPTATGAEYTAAGELIGHILIGRDMVREAASRHSIDAETLLRLEHIIVSHQRLPEWGAPKPPMTPEALLVHYADDIDAKFQTALCALADPSDEEFTSSRNPLQYRIFRGLRSDEPGTRPMS
jgi:3'-5' exoribonuclease